MIILFKIYRPEISAAGCAPFCWRILYAAAVTSPTTLYYPFKYAQSKNTRTPRPLYKWIEIRVLHNYNDSARKGNYATVTAIALRRCSILLL